MMNNININITWDMVREQKEAAKNLCLEGKLDEARDVVEKIKAMQAIQHVLGGHYDEATRILWDCSNLFGNRDWWADLADEEKFSELLHELR